MSKTIDNIKCGNYEVVDNQGVSITRHFTQCLEKEFADLEAKLEEKEKEKDYYQDLYFKIVEQFQQRVKYFSEQDQDKISFAIAELEKVKEHFINIKTPTLGVIRRAEMIMYIDNQIKQLKEGK